MQNECHELTPDAMLATLLRVQIHELEYSSQVIETEHPKMDDESLVY